MGYHNRQDGSMKPPYVNTPIFAASKASRTHFPNHQRDSALKSNSLNGPAPAPHLSKQKQSKHISLDSGPSLSTLEWTQPSSDPLGSSVSSEASSGCMG